MFVLRVRNYVRIPFCSLCLFAFLVNFVVAEELPSNRSDDVFFRRSDGEDIPKTGTAPPDGFVDPGSYPTAPSALLKRAKRPVYRTLI
ncbi:hypothetical protein B0H21DRAFT_471902 [Amylocystis lapponica]|nr:hypothetical protein B0H21DRAFT_471902 [Amylocystis lapponica]